MLLAAILRRFIREGRLRLVDARGGRHEFFGRGGPSVAVRITDRGLERRLLLNPDLALGEGYMDGHLVIEEGSLYELLDLLGRNYAHARRGLLAPLARLERVFRRLHQYNPGDRARRNVAHHYDLSGELYRLFLDSDRQYSCAYFEQPDMDLEQAQEAKKRHLAAKLLLRPGMRVLDIGSGWGGLALYLARNFEVEVTGLTLSVEQLEEARARARREGLADRVRFLLEDYREHRGCYDRIVSVGMFEHVGINHYRSFFAKLAELLTADGVALLHSIGRMAGPGSTSPWIRRYIFPGGYIPALSEVLPVVESLGLWACDLEILRLHYAETLRRWRERFLANRERVRELYDERFCRMWEYYLVASEIFFRRLDGMVFQLQLAKERDVVPLTRDYIHEAERELRLPALHAAE